MATAIGLDDAAEQLAQWVRGQRFGPVEVVHATQRVEADADDVPAIFLVLVLNDPPDGSETWPLEDVLSLRRSVLNQARELGIEAPVYVELSPETEPDQEPDQEEDEAGR
jgi:hypothetical protein